MRLSCHWDDPGILDGSRGADTGKKRNGRTIIRDVSRGEDMNTATGVYDEQQLLGDELAFYVSKIADT